MKTLTIRGVPDEVHEALQVRARLNRRSVNQEVIAELAGKVGPLSAEAEAVRKRKRAEEKIALAEKIRSGIAQFMTAAEIDAAVEEGREQF
jgi:plasmid stability protein